MSYRTGVCNFCGTGCGHLLNVSGGAVRGVFASPGHPVSRGRLCVRGWHIHELLATEGRITRPLVRRNGRFEEVPYDEAIALAAAGLGRYSGDEIGFLASPRASNEDNFALARLARSVFKSNVVGLASDAGHGSAVEVLSAGAGAPAMTGSLQDIRQAGLILVVGTDIARVNPIIGSEIHLAARRGADVVTISSRLTQTAKLSRSHLWVKPGTERLVLAAAASALVRKGLEDKAFIERHTEGFEAFARAVAILDPAAVSSAAGVDAASIEDLAVRLAGAKSAMAFFPTGISGLGRDTIAALSNLFLAAGKSRRDGCGVSPVAGIANLVGSYDMGAAHGFLPGYIKAEGAKSPDAMLASPASALKALVVADHDEEIVRHAARIKGLEFVAYIGAFANPFSEMAHVVIPSASFAEADGTYTNTERRIQLNRKKVEPPAGVFPAWRIFADIAARRGTNWALGSAEDVMAAIASSVPAYSAVTYAKLEKGFGIPWPCDERHPDGCARLSLDEAPRKLRFVDPGAPFEVPAVPDGFPVLLIPGKANTFWHLNNVMKKTHIPKREYNALLLQHPKGYVEIAVEDAGAIGVRDRRPVNVVSSAGSVRLAARISGDVRPGTAYVPYFVQEMADGFLSARGGEAGTGEDSPIPVRIEKV